MTKFSIERAGVEHARVIAEAGANVLQDLPNYTGVPFDIQHTVAALEMYLSLPDVGCFICVVNGETVGILMGVVASPWFTTQREMAEIIFWVRSDHRGTGLSRELIKSMEKWSKSVGAVKLLMAAGSGYETARIEKFYNRLGYRTCGLSTCKELT